MPLLQPRFFILLAGLAMTLTPLAAHAEPLAADTIPVSEEYAVRTWEIEDGLPSNTVTSIAQTPDGYLWLANPSELTRFDGVRFTPALTENTPGVESNRVETVFTSRDGELWIGLRQGGVARRHAGRFETILREQPDATEAWITSFAQDAKGAVWVTRASGSTVWRWQEDTNNLLAVDVGGFEKLHYICASVAGNIWIADWSGCAIFDGARFQAVDPNGGPWVWLTPSRAGGMWAVRAEKLVRYRENGEREFIADVPSLGISPKITALYEDSTGGLWMGTRGSGLYRFQNGKAERVPISHSSVSAITEDREGNLWVGTRGGGLNRLRRTAFFMRQHKHGLVQENTISLAEDAEKKLWVLGRESTLARSVDDSKRLFEPIPDWPQSGPIMALCAGPDGEVWFAKLNGLMRWKEGQFSVEPLNESLTGLLVDRQDDLWIASINEGLYRRHNGLIDRIAKDQVTKPRAMAEDAEGSIWVGTENGQVFRREGEGFVPIPLPGAKKGQIRFIVPDGKETVWIGASEGGLYRWRAGQVAHLPHGKGLPDDDLRSLAIGAFDDFWFGTVRGLFRASGAEIEEVIQGRRASLDCVSYGSNDGLPSTDYAFGFRGGTTRTRDGHLWFATTRGALEAIPQQLKPAVPPLPVLIEEIEIGGRPLPRSSGEKLVLPRKPGSLQIRYTLPELSAPEQVHFRYRLAGWGDDWVLAGRQRAATFAHLPPGDYRFEVAAALAGGPWLPATASQALTVRAAWWESVWFRLGLGLLGALAIGALVRSIVKRRMLARIRKLEQQSALERERSRLARDLHDQVGANLTQIALMAELANTPDTISRLADSARQAVDALDSVVWTANPRNDTLDSLLQYLVRFAGDFLKPAGMLCRIDFPMDVPRHHLPPEFRHHILLVVKEALNNAVKYSAAGEIHLGASFEERALTVTIADNGCGFADGTGLANESEGNGLRNMRERAAALRGECRIDSHPGAGTVVTLIVPWPVPP